MSNSFTDNITVIIVNWNGEKFLEKCLTMLMAQTAKAHEIILVDNASTDDSLSIVKKFPTVRIIAMNENAGFACGNNLAINAASTNSEWIALLNPDAFAMPDWLEELLASAYRNPEFDVFGSKLVMASNPNILDGAGDAYHITGLPWRIGHGRYLTEVAEREHEVFSPCAAAALYRKSALLKIAGFDEDFFCYVEDVDIGFRLRLAGYHCLYVPQAVVHHIGSGTTGGLDSDFAIYHGHRNLVWAFVKNVPSIIFWLLLPLHILMNLVTIAWFVLIRKRGRVIWRAKRDALHGVSKMWSKRNQVQATRVASVAEIWRQLDKRLNILKRGLK